MKKILFIAMLASIFSFCKKETVSTQSTVMVYGMTQCSDPWQDEDYFKDKAAALKAYLTKQGITVLELSIVEETGFIFCQACTCPSGFIATVKVDDKDIAAMEKLKFTKK